MVLRRMLAATALAAALAAPAHAAKFVVAPGGDNLVQFESKAKIETFTGKTSQVEGRVELDPAQIGDSIAVRVVVNIASLDTGIKLRNKHMCDNHLDCDQFPRATFAGGRVSNRATAAGKTTFDLSGSFDLHGVVQPLTVPVELTRTEAGDLQITTKFPVKLADHKIARPQMLVLKLNDVQQVSVKLLARAEK